MIPTTGRILAIDWGEIRIGLALSDETQTLATPLETLVRRAGKRFPMRRLLELTTRYHPVGPGRGASADSRRAAKRRARLRHGRWLRPWPAAPVFPWSSGMSG